jgi:hypothetical protein
LPGQRHETVGVAPLIEGIEFGGLIADKAFDANWIIAALNERGAKIVVSQMPRRKAPLRIDRDLYKWRHLIRISSEIERVKAHRHAQRQNGYELQRHDPSGSRCHQLTMILNRP